MFRDILAIVFIIFGIIVIYFGALAPFWRAQNFVYAYQNTENFKTLEELENTYNKAFDFYAPLGQEEMAKFLSERMFNVLKSGQMPEEIALEIVKYVESNSVQDNNIIQLMQTGNLYEALWRLYGGDNYFLKAESYYKKANEIGPRVPQPLYELFDIYKDSNQENKMEEIGRNILELWPEEKGVVLNN